MLHISFVCRTILPTVAVATKIKKTNELQCNAQHALFEGTSTESPVLYCLLFQNAKICVVLISKLAKELVFTFNTRQNSALREYLFTFTFTTYPKKM
jgi:hypothetical protein